MPSIVSKIPFPLRILLAILLVVVGLVGFVLPFLHGWFFIVLAIYVLYPEKGKAIFQKVKAKFRKIIFRR